MAARGEAFTLLTTDPSPEQSGNEASLWRALPAGSLKVEQVR
jgi:hypothetical protein